jgi:hypothetical protein
MPACRILLVLVSWNGTILSMPSLFQAGIHEPAFISSHYSLLEAFILFHIVENMPGRRSRIFPLGTHLADNFWN